MRLPEKHRPVGVWAGEGATKTQTTGRQIRKHLCIGPVTYISIYLFIYIFMYLPTSLRIYRYICLAVYLLLVDSLRSGRPTSNMIATVSIRPPWAPL
jgi:hypothetical protein